MNLKDMTAKDINYLFGKLERKEAKICNEKCKYFSFPHLQVACVLSEVFSVKQGELCCNFEEKVDHDI